MSNLPDNDRLKTLCETAEPATPLNLSADTLQPVAERIGGRSGSAPAAGGRFRILRPLASGGLGEVFLARDEELNREVALKQIKADYRDLQEMTSRFTLEAEITGRLEHPAIVPVYGLGHHEDGRPYYAMRLIRGESLREAIDRLHADGGAGWDRSERRVELRTLLSRFTDVCYAVAFAHSRGVVHRDLKPDNIMLGPFGETLLVDWGLAKLVPRESAAASSAVASPELPQLSTLHPAAADESTPTQMGVTLGTPSYMSPEQAAGLVDQISPASDIYGLGATLYALLTGRPPFSGRLSELRQAVIVGKFPPPRSVDPRIPRGLEAICMKAMSLDPSRRYPSAHELAADVEAWLADAPLTARPEPAVERAARWVRHHQTLVSGTVAAMLVALVSLSVSVVLLAAANDQVRRAKGVAEQREREAAHNFQIAHDAVDNYLTRVSQDVGLRAHGLERLRRDLLTAARGFYEQFVQQQPQDPQLQSQRGRAYLRLADITADIGSPSEAISLFSEARRAFADLSQRYPDRPEYRGDLARSYVNLSLLHSTCGRSEAAEQSLQAALTILQGLVRDCPGVPSFRDELATVHHNRAKLHFNGKRYPAAQADYAAALALREQLVRDEPDAPEYESKLASTQSNLGLLHHVEGRYDQAEQALKAARTMQEGLVAQHPGVPEYCCDLAATCNNLAVLYAERTARLADAETAYLDARQTLTQLVGEHPEVVLYQRDLARTHNNLATLYAKGQRWLDAETAYEAAQRIHERLAAAYPDVPEHRDDLAATSNNLANVLDELDRPAEAESAYRKAIQIRQQLVADYPQSPDYRGHLAAAYNNLGTLLTAANRLDEADVALRAAIKIRERLLSTYPDVLEYAVALATISANAAHLALELGRPEPALEFGQQTLAVLAPLPAAIRETADAARSAENARAACADSLARLGRHAEALRYWEEALQDESASNRDALRLGRAESLAQVGDPATAVAEAQSLIESARGFAPILYRLAAICAVAARRAGQDASLADDERQRRQQQYGTSALDALRLAREAGFFDGPDKVRQFRDEPCWQPLRQRADYQEFAKQLGVE